jgi:hypothetical protein
VSNSLSFTRALFVVGSIGVAAVPVTFGASAPAGRSGVVPVTGKPAPCREQPPKLLGAGRTPHARLLLDLKPLASIRRGIVNYDHVTSHVQIAKTSRTSRETRKVVGVYATRTLGSSGHLPVSEHFAVTFPGSKVPKAPHNTFSDNGYFDELNGGAYGTTYAGTGGTPITDRFPTQSIGVGATWRVVKCDLVYETPAKETRTYTLRSVANGVISMTYRDVVELDPASTELGSQTIGGTKLTLRLLTLHGRATGTMRVPVENGLAQRQRTVTRIFLTAQATAGGTPGAVIHTTISDILTQAPTS